MKLSVNHIYEGSTVKLDTRYSKLFNSTLHTRNSKLYYENLHP